MDATQPPPQGLFPPADIADWLQQTGRLDYVRLQKFAQHSQEQLFIQTVKHASLVGSRIVHGKFPKTNVSRDTANFFRVSLPEEKDDIPDSTLLQRVVYPFIHKPSVCPEDEGLFTVGRTDNNDFVIPDYTISRSQAVLQMVSPHRLLVKDQGSINPTLVNGESSRGREMACREGSRVQFGRYEFLFSSSSALYCHLVGIELTKKIEQFVDSLGKADYDALKDYAQKHGEAVFVQLVRNPSLVGMGVFRGYGVERQEKGALNATMGFLPDISKGREATQIRLLGRSIYPVMRQDPDADGDPAIVIGRQENNDLLMPDGSISSRHAAIRADGEGRYYIQDLGSTNGTAVNGKPLGPEEKELLDGDKVKMGRYQFLFLFPSSLYWKLVRENF